MPVSTSSGKQDRKKKNSKTSILNNQSRNIKNTDTFRANYEKKLGTNHDPCERLDSGFLSMHTSAIIIRRRLHSNSPAQLSTDIKDYYFIGLKKLFKIFGGRSNMIEEIDIS